MKLLEDIRVMCHQLAEPDFEKPLDVVSWMGAMQAQDYTMSKWAVGIRLKNAGLRQVNDALAKGEIVRTHILRPTWHYVAGKDLRWMRQLTSVRVKKTIDSWVKGNGLDISEEHYTKCNDCIGNMLAGKKCLTREEIETELERRGILVADDRVKRYILRAEMEGIVCSGADRDGKPTYTLLEEHIAPVAALHREEALALLALRYFRSHSPATLKDFIWWSGLTVAEAKQAVGLISDWLLTEYFEGKEYWVCPSYRELKRKNVTCFLPPFDEYLISYKERNTVIPAKYQAKAYNRWGIFYPVILYRGQIVGNWSKVSKKGAIRLVPTFFEPTFKIDPGQLQRAEERYRKFILNSV